MNDPSGGAAILPEDEQKPTCSCHGVPMLWQRDPRRRGGGTWRCHVTRRLSWNRKNKTEAGRQKKLRYQRGTGYVTQRMHALLKRRSRIQEQLEDLNGS